MIILLYTLIILIATTAGALGGLGGGVIIKPLFDALGVHDASTVGVYSTLAVFTMCIVSIGKQLKNGFSFDLKMVISISLGSLCGGLAGEKIFSVIAADFSNSTVKIIQATLLAICLVVILGYTINKNKIKHYHLKNIIAIFAVGLFLGSISIFLGIGGGPLNVALLMILFSFTIKEATIYSIATIFFSQISKIATLLITKELFTYDLSLVPYICVAAIVGGMMGTIINQKMSESRITQFFNGLMAGLLALSLYNIISNIM